MIQSNPIGGVMTNYRRGDHVKIELADLSSGQKEWVWVEVDYADDVRQLVFGRLDNEPVVNTDVGLGVEVAVSFEKIVEHRCFRSMPGLRGRDGPFDA